MGFGVITGITCIVRTSLTYHIKQPDLSWVGVGTAMAKMLEVNFGIIAACLPLMKPLYTFIRSGQTPRRASSTTKTTSPSSRTPWYRFWSSRTLVGAERSPLKPKASKESNADTNRQWTWRKPLQDFSPSAVRITNDDPLDTNGSIGLPLQGIRKTTEFGVEEEKINKNRETGLEEFV